MEEDWNKSIEDISAVCDVSEYTKGGKKIAQVIIEKASERFEIESRWPDGYAFVNQNGLNHESKTFESMHALLLTEPAYTAAFHEKASKLLNG